MTVLLTVAGLYQIEVETPCREAAPPATIRPSSSCPIFAGARDRRPPRPHRRLPAGSPAAAGFGELALAAFRLQCRLRPGLAPVLRRPRGRPGAGGELAGGAGAADLRLPQPASSSWPSRARPSARAAPPAGRTSAACTIMPFPSLYRRVIDATFAPDGLRPRLASRATAPPHPADPLAGAAAGGRRRFEPGLLGGAHPGAPRRRRAAGWR